MAKVLRIGIPAEIHHLDPARAQDLDTFFVLHQIVEAPFDWSSEEDSTIPCLFERLKRDRRSGPSAYRARVRSGKVFSDGRPLTAADIAKCLRKVTPVREQARVEADGDDVVFFLERPNARFDLTLSFSQCAVHRMFGDEPIGTGPYRVAEHRPDHIRLVRNPHYEPAAPIDELVFRTYPLDADGRPSALIAAIEAGEVDYTNALARDAINSLSGVRKSIKPGTSTAMLYLNAASPHLRDARMRRAIAHSVDRRAVAQTSYSNSLAFTANCILPRSLGRIDDDWLVYDPARAAAITAEPDVRKPARLRLLTTWAPRPYLPHPGRFYNEIARQLQEIGIAVDVIRPATSSEFIRHIIAGDADMTLAGWAADTLDPADFLESNLASYRVPNEDNISVANNNGRLQSSAMDDALAQFRADHEESSLHEIMRLMSEEAVLVPLAYGPSAVVTSFSVRGFKPSPLSIVSLSQLDLS